MINGLLEFVRRNPQRREFVRGVVRSSPVLERMARSLMPRPPQPILLPPTEGEALERVAAVALRGNGLADKVIESGLLDLEYYSGSTGIAFSSIEDAANHYVLYGEARNYRPSRAFDPLVYRLSYPDLANLDRLLMLHYIDHGKHEGRFSTLDIDILRAPGAKKFRPDRETVLLVLHEASFTGAPILGLNLARHLGQSFNVVTLCLKGGELEAELAKYCFKVITPAVGTMAFSKSALLADKIVRPLSQQFRLEYVVINSAEAGAVVDACHILGLPTVSLVHEFTEYVLPTSRMENLISYSHRVVFSSMLTENSARHFNVAGNFRNALVIPQGKSSVPEKQETHARKDLHKILERRMDDGRSIFIGCGFVQIRKGVDLFLRAAQEITAKLGKDNVAFLWVGDGYEPYRDYTYSIWLRDQVQRSGLESVVDFVGSVGAEDLERLYQVATAMFLSSRLDPFPNVAIDAMHAGLPVVCFDKATGIAEYFQGNPVLSELVAPYLDVGTAAGVLAEIAQNEDKRQAMREGLQELAASHFQMADYVQTLRGTLRDARLDAEQEAKDVETLLAADVLAPDYLQATLPPGLSPREAVRRYVRLCAAGTFGARYASRRPLPGFSPHIYRELNMPGEDAPHQNPLAHWVLSGKPEGPWLREVRDVTDSPVPPSSMRVALHLHLYYADMLEDFIARLEVNSIKPDLFISTGSEAAAATIRRRLRAYGKRTKVQVSVVPNRGRDIGPMLTEFAEPLSHYDLIGHLHAKKSAALQEMSAGKGAVDVWREFLLENLIGDTHAALDAITSLFAADEELGLVFPEDPHIVSWTGNYEQGQLIAGRIGLKGDLPRNVEFPIGNMFYARPKALLPLLKGEFTWEDYPDEPIGYDGTILHAIERMTPIVCEAQGYRWMTTCIAGVTR